MFSTIFDSMHVQNAINFRDSFDDNNIYLWTGRGATPWTDEVHPPAYTATVTNDIGTRNTIQYLIKLAKSDTALGIAKNLWTLNTVYTAYSATDASLFTEPFPVVNGNNSVYKCLNNNNGSQSKNVPVGSSTNTIVLSDGYNWKFMYNLNDTMATFLTSSFLPVPTDTASKTSFQLSVEAAAMYASGSPPKGHGANAAFELGANNVIISKKVDFALLNNTTVFQRQFGLLINPILNTGTAATANIYKISDNLIDTQSGQLLTLTNHEVINSTEDDNETIQTVINF